jgi:prophage antirepressor-like protein
MNEKTQTQSTTALDYFPAKLEGGTFRVRSLERDRDSWYVANDVTDILGYADCDQAVHMHCKSPILLQGAESELFTSRPEGITIIAAGDIYRLIINSELPAAQRFEERIMNEVLPAIRETGGYIPTSSITLAGVKDDALRIVEPTAGWLGFRDYVINGD